MKINCSIIRKSIATVVLVAILSVMVAPLTMAASERSFAHKTSPSSSRIQQDQSPLGPVIMGGNSGLPGKGGQGPKGDPDDPDIAAQKDPEKSKNGSMKMIWLLLEMFRSF